MKPAILRSSILAIAKRQSEITPACETAYRGRWRDETDRADGSTSFSNGYTERDSDSDQVTMLRSWPRTGCRKSQRGKMGWNDG
ncbi:MAG: hypothetical protein EA381_14670 [Planctomycetaceae bacterium]|nr:MAG: hypothetical protein EA381_14670 [Planctomycetaceae bacterium]